MLHKGLVIVLCDSLEGGYMSALAILESGAYTELVVNAAPFIQGARSGDGQGTLLATNAMREPVLATPALAGDVVYIRTAHGLYALGGPPAQSEPRQFPDAVQLEDTSETSANVSMGDLDGDGDLDLVLAKGRHWPLVDRVLMNNGQGVFAAHDLAPTADRSYSAVLADVDGNGSLDLVLSNDRPDDKLVYLNDGKARFRRAGTWGSPAWNTRKRRWLI